MKITHGLHWAQCLLALDIGASSRGWRVYLGSNVARIAFARRRRWPGLQATMLVLSGSTRSGTVRNPLPRWVAGAPPGTCRRARATARAITR